MPFLPPNHVKALKANEDYKTVKNWHMNWTLFGTGGSSDAAF